MTDVDRYQPAEVRPWIRDMESAWNLARRLEGAREFIPNELQGRGEAIMAMILTGLELDMGPLWALRNLNVVNGRVSMSAEGMRALVFRAGHSIWPLEATDQKVIMAGRRRGDDRDPVTVEWTAHRAQTAGLTGNPSWRKYPRGMLTAWATAELCRLLFPDVIAGMAGDELEPVDANGSTPDVDGPAPVRRRRSPAVAAPGAVHDPQQGDTGQAGAVPQTRAEIPLPSDRTAPVDLDQYDALLQIDAGESVPSREPPPAEDLPTAPDSPAPPDDDELRTRRKMFAQLLEALPGMSRAERERYRHALIALVTRNRPQGPTIHFGATDQNERLDLSARIADLRTRVLLAHTEPDGSIVFTAKDRAATVCPDDDETRWSVIVEAR